MVIEDKNELEIIITMYLREVHKKRHALWGDGDSVKCAKSPRSYTKIMTGEE